MDSNQYKNLYIFTFLSWLYYHDFLLFVETIIVVYFLPSISKFSRIIEMKIVPRLPKFPL